MVKLYHPENGYFFSGDDIEIQATIDRGGMVVPAKPKIVAETVEEIPEIPKAIQKKYARRK